MKNVGTFSLCLILVCLIFAASPGSAIADSFESYHLGGREGKDPLKIVADARGDLSLHLWQPQQGFGTPKAYVSQYRKVQPIGDVGSHVQWGSQFRWQRQDETVEVLATPHFADATFDPDGVTRLKLPEAASVESGDGSLVFTWSIPDPNLTLSRILEYEPGSWKLRETFVLQNEGSETLTNLWAATGGDTMLYGDESVSASWQDSLSRLIHWPQHPSDHGLFLLDPQTEPHDYHSGMGTDLRQLFWQETLSIMDGPVHANRKVLMRWQQDSLAAGDAWVIEQRQELTPPRLLQLEGSQAVAGTVGDTLRIEHEAVYEGETIQDFELMATAESKRGWDWQIEFSGREPLADGTPGFRQTVTLEANLDDPDASEVVTLRVQDPLNPYFLPQVTTDVEVKSAPKPTSPVETTPSEPTSPAEPTKAPTPSVEDPKQDEDPSCDQDSATETTRDTIEPVSTSNPSPTLRPTVPNPPTGSVATAPPLIHPAAVILLLIGLVVLGICLCLMLSRRKKD